SLAEPLDVAPHVPSPHGVQVERRVAPPLPLEKGAEQERLPDQRDLRGQRRRFNPHGRDVAVGAGKLEPELNHSESILFAAPPPQPPPEAVSRLPGSGA